MSEEMFNLADYYLFDRLKEGLGEKTCLRYGEHSYSYEGVAERTRELAKYFHSIGVAKEQRIYTVLPDTPPFAWSFFATLNHGAVVTMGNPQSPTDDLAYVLDYVRASVLITVPRVAEALAPSLKKNPHLRSLILVPETATGDDPEVEVQVSELLKSLPFEVISMAQALEGGRSMKAVESSPTRRDDQAIWLFTSGSTGKSKAVMHTHRDFAFNTEIYAKKTVGYRQEDSTVSVARLFFGYATGTNLMFPFAVGGTACLFSERPTPESLAKAIEMYRPSIVTNVPTMMSKLLEYDETRTREGKPKLDLSSVRFHLSAGEALPPSLLKRFQDRFPGDVYDGIGSAEMFHIYCSNRPGDIKPGSLGRVVDGYEIKVLPTEATEPGVAEVAPGETGVLWVKGESVGLGYFQDREKSWKTFHGKWCCTGDLFRKDEEGYLYFGGRADSMFKVGGVFVAPLEIEECLMQHSAVALAAIIPAKREDLAKPKAFVILRDSAKTRIAAEKAKSELREELQNHVKDRLSMHKYPRWVVFVDDIPKNDRGKVNRKVLIEREKEGKNPWA